MTPLGALVMCCFGGWGYGGMQTREEGNKRAGANSVLVLDSENMKWTEPITENPNPISHL